MTQHISQNDYCNFTLLILTMLFSFLSVHSNFLEKIVTRWLYRESPKEFELRTKRASLQKEQRTLNITDNFPKYSRIQRKINSIDEELREAKENKEYNGFLLKFGLNYGMKICITLILLFISLYFRRVPVLKLEEKINLSPFNTIISYPNEQNTVSAHFWILCCTAVARLI